MQILIVEDNKPVSLVLSSFVEQAGYEYVIAADGEQALKLFEQRDIGLAFVDVELPGLDGYQVTRTLRNQAPQLPLIVISANTSAAWQQQAIDAGADEFLAKPIRLTNVRDLLTRFLPS